MATEAPQRVGSSIVVSKDGFGMMMASIVDWVDTIAEKDTTLKSYSNKNYNTDIGHKSYLEVEAAVVTSM